eukprot:5216979-Amphidinium_carterae.1
MDLILTFTSFKIIGVLGVLIGSGVHNHSCDLGGIIPPISFADHSCHVNLTSVESQHVALIQVPKFRSTARARNTFHLKIIRDTVETKII